MLHPKNPSRAILPKERKSIIKYDFICSGDRCSQQQEESDANFCLDPPITLCQLDKAGPKLLLMPGVCSVHMPLLQASL